MLFNFCFYLCIIVTVLSSFKSVIAPSSQEKKAYFSFAVKTLILGVIALLTIHYLAPYMNL